MISSAFLIHQRDEHVRLKCLHIPLPRFDWRQTLIETTNVFKKLGFNKEKYVAIVRIMMGWVFFWPFLDKTFGLGYATESGSGWIDGGAPTAGFLKFGTNPEGLFYDTFVGMADSALVEWLFMLGLLGIGLAFLTGMGVRIAGWSAAIMLFLMWLAVFPTEHNPFLDDHLVYAVICLGLAYSNCGDTWGLGEWWKQQSFVQDKPYLY